MGSGYISSVYVEKERVIEKNVGQDRQGPGNVFVVLVKVSEAFE
jgi:hypothetical protein